MLAEQLLAPLDPALYAYQRGELGRTPKQIVAALGRLAGVLQAPRAQGGDSMTDGSHGVRELRLVVTAEDYDAALRFYRDVLGLHERAAFVSEGGRVSILEAGRATLELTDPPHAAYIDEVEVGRRVAGHVRVAFEVDDSHATTEALEAAGATVIAAPTRTPWNSLNARLEAPGGAAADAVPGAGRRSRNDRHRRRVDLCKDDWLLRPVACGRVPRFWLAHARFPPNPGCTGGTSAFPRATPQPRMCMTVRRCSTSESRRHACRRASRTSATESDTTFAGTQKARRSD